MKQIREREEWRPWDALDAFITAGNNGANDEAALAAALDAIVNNWYVTAELYGKAKLKGAQSTYIVPLRHAAAELDKVIKALHGPRPDAAAESPRFERIAIEAGLDEPVHAFEVAAGGSGVTCTAMVERDGHGDQCGRYASHPAHRIDGPTERPSLDQLIADAAGRESITVDYKTPPPQVDASTEDVQAYLRGETNSLPGPDPGPSTVHDATHVLDADATEAEIQKMTFAAREEGAKMQLPTSTPPVPLLGQPGDAGAGYSPTYVPPGGVPLTFAELMTPVPVTALPPHLSHSQIETIGDCPTKYRAQRLPTAVEGTTIPQIPQWALIGGSAFHAAVEAWERLMLGGNITPGLSVQRDAIRTGSDHVPGPWDMDCDATWRYFFEAECAKIEASSPVPRSMWRASKQGAEGETWWNANGPEMLRRYLAARPDEPTATLPTGPPDVMGALEDAIEIERLVTVPTPYGLIPYKAILDRVTVRNTADVTTLIIRDYKTGDRLPDSTSQLGEYANVLRLLGVPPQVKILGTFFNARRGTWTPEVDLDELWPAEWFTYLVTSAESQRRALTSGPTPARPSLFCGGCSVRWACPIKGVRR
jgi:hypothetical protein